MHSAVVSDLHSTPAAGTETHSVSAMDVTIFPIADGRDLILWQDPQKVGDSRRIRLKAAFTDVAQTIGQIIGHVSPEIAADAVNNILKYTTDSLDLTRLGLDKLPPEILEKADGKKRTLLAFTPKDMATLG